MVELHKEQQRHKFKLQKHLMQATLLEVKQAVALAQRTELAKQMMASGNQPSV